MAGESLSMCMETSYRNKRQRIKRVWSHLQSCRIPAVSLLYSPNLDRADQVCSGIGDGRGKAKTSWKWSEDTLVDRTESFLPDPTPVPLWVWHSWQERKYSNTSSSVPFSLLLKNTHVYTNSDVPSWLGTICIHILPLEVQNELPLLALLYCLWFCFARAEEGNRAKQEEHTCWNIKWLTGA